MARTDRESEGFERFKADMKAKRPARLYIFTGEEAYLRSHWLQRLHQLLVEPFVEAFNYHRFTAENFRARDFADSIEAVPMMAARSLVQVDDVDLFRLSESERADTASALRELPEYCTVVLVYETVEYKPDKRMKALAGALEQAQVVSFHRPSERELATWAARHFKSLGKTLDDPTCQYLIARTGGDMTTLRGEIGKVAAYASAETIRREDIDAVVEPVLEAVVFDLTDSVAAGRYDRAVEQLAALFQKQEEPIPILGALSGQMRRILTAKTLLRAGKGARELMSLCAIPSYPAQKTVDFARRVSDGFAERAVLLCLETDARLKTSYDEPERLLELLVMELAQEAKHA